jgi:hypothetical protein
MYRHYNKILPVDLQHTWSTIQERGRRLGAPTLRNEADFFIPPARTDHLARCPLSMCPRLWNSLPNELKSLNSYSMFCSQLKDRFINDLPSNCTRLFAWSVLTAID